MSTIFVGCSPTQPRGWRVATAAATASRRSRSPRRQAVPRRSALAPLRAYSRLAHPPLREAKLCRISAGCLRCLRRPIELLRWTRCSRTRTPSPLQRGKLALFFVFVFWNSCFGFLQRACRLEGASLFSGPSAPRPFQDRTFGMFWNNFQVFATYPLQRGKLPHFLEIVVRASPTCLQG